MTAARRLLCLLLLLMASCGDDVGGDGGTGADAAPACGVAPTDGPSCAAVTCPAACDQASTCGRFCGGGDCYTCSAGTWTRVIYSCIGNMCTGGEVVDAGTGDR